MRGSEAFSSRLYKPVLIDAHTGAITDQRELPWYLTALLVSQPLHFGDYGGGWMQLLWALLDVATIIVLGSGLYLWIKRGQAEKRHVEAARQSRQASAPAPVLAAARSGEGR